MGRGGVGEGKGERRGMMGGEEEETEEGMKGGDE